MLCGVKTMVSFFSQVFGKAAPPTREAVDAVQAMEVAEATRQRLERAIKYRQREVNDLFDKGILPERVKPK
jgi:vacuolar-type H+-ATPase subunit D/Vma8